MGTERGLSLLLRSTQAILILLDRNHVWTVLLERFIQSIKSIFTREA